MCDMHTWVCARTKTHTHTHTHTHTQNLNLVEHERLGDRTTTTRATTCTDPSAHPRCKRAKYLSGRYVWLWVLMLHSYMLMCNTYAHAHIHTRREITRGVEAVGVAEPTHCVLAHQHTSTSTQPTHRGSAQTYLPTSLCFPLPPFTHFPALKQVETHETTLLLLCCDEFFKDNTFCFSPEQVLLHYDISGTVWTHTVSRIHLNSWTHTHTQTLWRKRKKALLSVITTPIKFFLSGGKVCGKVSGSREFLATLWLTVFAYHILW